MFKSIFSKYFAIMAIAILVSFVALCVTLMFFSTRFWLTDKKSSLHESAQYFAAFTAANETADHQFTVGFDKVFNLMAQSNSGLNSVLITDEAGHILISADPSLAGKDIPPDIMPTVQVQSGASTGYFETAKLGGFFAASQYTCAVRVTDSPDGAATIGYVFVSATTQTMANYLYNNLQVFLLASLGVLALTFIAVYIMTYRLVKPLRQMASATRRFSEGDFSARVRVGGRDEVAVLAASLNNMAVSLSSLEDMRRSFVANVSHELKTPMTTIAGFIDGILDGTIPAEQRSHYLQIVSDEVKRLSRLVKTMLDLSRMDSGQLSLHPVRFDLTELICTVLVSFERRIDGKQVDVTGLEDCPRMEVEADYDMIGQVIYNLLDNAVKFINPGGRLLIELGKRDSRVYCRVRNTGEGIPAAEQKRIFERFYKSDKSRSLDKNGVGLGLYIVQSVIREHGGEIIVRSVEGEYTEFVFWLPTGEQPTGKVAGRIQGKPTKNS